MPQHNLMRQICTFVLLASASAGAALSLVLAPISQSHEQVYGYSYLLIEVTGHPIENFTVDPNYRGWLQIEAVRAMHTSSSVHSMAAVKTQNADDGRWKSLASILRAGKLGPGEIRFDAGDDGGFAPVLGAQKRKQVIQEAELALYAEDTDKLVGKFKIKGIRVLSLEDVPASACPMYEVTLSFRSIVTEH